VLRNLKELLAQFLGAAEFVVYFASDDKTELCRDRERGREPSTTSRASPPIARSAALGEASSPLGLARVAAPRQRSGRDTSKPTIADPACRRADAPRRAHCRYHRDLRQRSRRRRNSSTDNELFKLLGAQAAPALVNARLFADAGRKVPGVQAFLDGWRTD
jgi:hypothetical protein